jgi:hypothetical protein
MSKPLHGDMGGCKRRLGARLAHAVVVVALPHTIDHGLVSSAFVPHCAQNASALPVSRNGTARGQ